MFTLFFFFFQAEDGIRDDLVTGVQTCALPIYNRVITNSAYTILGRRKWGRCRKKIWVDVGGGAATAKIGQYKKGALPQRKLGRRKWGRYGSESWAGEGGGAATDKTGQEKGGGLGRRRRGRGRGGGWWPL